MTRKVGRNKNFETEELEQFIATYISKHKHSTKRLVAAQIATYLKKEHGIEIEYYHFTRNEKVKEYIRDFNKTLSGALTSTPSSQDLPIYESINVKKFLEKNNTSGKLEKALKRLESNREKVHISYGELQDKHVSVLEKNLKLMDELKALKKENESLKTSYQQQLKEINSEGKKIKNANKSLRSKITIYESFLRKYHYSAMYEYALYLENIITSGVDVNIKNKNMFSLEGYKNNNFDLSELIKTYESVTTPVSTEYEDDDTVTSGLKISADLVDGYDEDEDKFEATVVVSYSEATEPKSKESKSKLEHKTKPKAERLKQEVLDDIFD
ncbi:hypothetical protein Q0O85_19325 [Priestia megaterium]|uniref:hypothetical protein n=1 Tax=Priestia megaterium TaxID=1404 RepID=UPI0034578C6A